MMEQSRQFIGIFRNALGCSFFGCPGNELVVVFHFLNQIQFAFLGQFGEICISKLAVPGDAGFFGLVEQAVDAGVGILDVVYRVIAGLFLRQVDIEIHLGIQSSSAEEIPCRIGADFFHQFPKAHGLTGTFGHLDRLSITKQGDHLEQHDFKVIRVVAQEFHGGLQTDDIAVVVSAPDINQFVVPTVDFISYIGNIGAEIGRNAIGTNDHPVFVVPVLGGPEPEGAVFFVHVIFVFQNFQCCIDLFRIEGPFREPVVKVHVEFVKVFLQVFQLFMEAQFFENSQSFFFVHVQVFLAVFFQNVFGGVDDILSMVAIFRYIAVNAVELQVAGIDGFGQVVNLAAGIVDVVFRQHVIASGAEQVHHSGTIGSPTGMADVKQTGRIGGNVFHQDAVFFIFW